MQKIHVLLKKEDLGCRPDRRDKIAVVFDVIFATSSIVTALAHGAIGVTPALDKAHAECLARQYPKGECILSGELDSHNHAGYWPYEPLAMKDSKLRNKRLVYTTTNGTIALCRSMGFQRVYVAALLNASAVAETIARSFSKETIILVCAGSDGRVSLEDTYAAGHMISLLLGYGHEERFTLSDTAKIALMTRRKVSPLEALRQSSTGSLMVSRGLKKDVEYAAELDHYTAVPILSEDGVILSVAT